MLSEDTCFVSIYHHDEALGVNDQSRDNLTGETDSFVSLFPEIIPYCHISTSYILFHYFQTSDA